MILNIPLIDPHNFPIIWPCFFLLISWIFEVYFVGTTIHVH